MPFLLNLRLVEEKFGDVLRYRNGVVLRHHNLPKVWCRRVEVGNPLALSVGRRLYVQFGDSLQFA